MAHSPPLSHTHIAGSLSPSFLPVQDPPPRNIAVRMGNRGDYRAEAEQKREEPETVSVSVSMEVEESAERHSPPHTDRERHSPPHPDRERHHSPEPTSVTLPREASVSLPRDVPSVSAPRDVVPMPTMPKSEDLVRMSVWERVCGC